MWRFIFTYIYSSTLLRNTFQVPSYSERISCMGRWTSSVLITLYVLQLLKAQLGKIILVLFCRLLQLDLVLQKLGFVVWINPAQSICCLHILYLSPPSFSSPDDYVVPEKSICLGCPTEIDENSEDLRVPLSVSISKYNSISDSTHLFTLHSVGRSTRQVETGWYEERGEDEEEKKKVFLYCLHLYLFPCRSSQDSGSSWVLIWGGPPVPRVNTQTSTSCVSLIVRMW